MNKNKFIKLITLGSLFLIAFLIGSWLGNDGKATAQACVQFKLGSCAGAGCNPCPGWTVVDAVNSFDPKSNWRIGFCYKE